VQAEVRRAAPFIAQQAKDGVFAAIQSGKTESRLVGRRN
jgi:hypothetical protein